MSGAKPGKKITSGLKLLAMKFSHLELAFRVDVANLLKTAVSVLASTVRLTVSFMEPLMTVSVMLRCSQQADSSSNLDLPQSLAEVDEGEATVVPNQPSQSGGGVKKVVSDLTKFKILNTVLKDT